MSTQEREQANHHRGTTKLSQSKRILVAENDHVNRWLATRLLEQKGYIVNAVTNGEAALDALEKESFDLILLDLQMPLPNGWEATQDFRQQQERQQIRVPIIAFTTEVGTPCSWQAGIDSYLTKPIRTEEFYRRIEAVLKLHSDGVQTDKSSAVFDYNEALARVNGEVEVLQNTAETFLGRSRHLLSAMRRAITKGDPYNLDFAAHRLKATASNLSAYRIVGLAERVELMGSTHNLTEAQTAVIALEHELEQFRTAFEAAMQAFTTSPPPTPCPPLPQVGQH